MAGWRDVPPLVRHSVVAIYNKSTGGGPDGFIKAMRIARDTLAKSGYVYHGAKLAVLQDIQLTGKGWVRNLHHAAEGKAGEAKDLQFAELWKMIEPKLWELDGPGGKQPPRAMLDNDGKEAEAKVPGDDVGFDDRPKAVYPPPK